MDLDAGGRWSLLSSLHFRVPLAARQGASVSFREEVKEGAWPTPRGGRKREGGVAEVCLPRLRPR